MLAANSVAAALLSPFAGTRGLTRLFKVFHHPDAGRIELTYH
ncbi:hypothetical protein [Micromonospora sp. NPDC048839]